MEVTKFKDLRWKKAYHGPFPKDQAEELCKDLCERQPIGIKGARLRKRKNQDAFDIYINVHRDWRNTTKHNKQ